MLLPLAMTLQHVGMLALLVFGFGFVIFWHELGHFLAAKWVGIRVEQFAVGFGQAMFAWRKGIGFRFGNTQKDYREQAEKYLLDQRGPSQALEQPEFSDEQIASAADAMGLGETEYRLNWIPLGGYVKMMGQDDLKPDAVVEDPRAYNKKSIPARMLVISAGVIMNVILAAIGFMVLFSYGFKVPPAWVGNIISDSPAQKAGLQVGDHILSFDGKPQEDFTKITLNTALVEESAPLTMVVNRPDTLAVNTTFHKVTLTVTPARRPQESGFLAIGFEAPRELRAARVEADELADLKKEEANLSKGVLALQPGDTVTAVNGQPVVPKDYVLFDHIVQSSFGKPLDLTIEDSSHVQRHAENDVHFAEDFYGTFDILGIVPRTQVIAFSDNSVVHADDRLHIGDVIVSIKLNGDTFPNPTREQLLQQLNTAGHQEKPLDMTVLRDGQLVTVSDIKASIKVDKKEDRYGIGANLINDEREAVIAGLRDSSPFKAAGLLNGDRITSLDDQPVKTWFDVHRILARHAGDKPVKVEYARENVAEKKQATLNLTPDQLASVKNIRYLADIQEGGLMEEYIEVRKAKNLAQAAKWGVTETRDFILQFYLTLRRMVDRSVSPANMMGPVGIFIGGKRFAYKGIDWLLWFLCMISANLAVVNFLPIPVVDGGQFMFLIFEKIKGKPLSPRSMAIAQYVGLAFLAALVLFVTYHDILRSI
ncbi:MAG TPA: site-2 protease family protein [Tepidisphaeraceae bacterium]|jgi:regulator of sigma E protease|nr:site-2 protease family protein [Tepidisphaeraceae bacterium]